MTPAGNDVASSGAAPRPGPEPITVLAGVNGAGKSSIFGEALRLRGEDFFNPDAYARELRAADPTLDVASANARAWEVGRAALARAIERREGFAFETTLGGRTITDLLHTAAQRGRDVEIFHVGLDSAERHIARVQARVARGGHDIPEARIRARYTDSRENLAALMPRLTLLAVFDNSAEADPDAGVAPEPRRLFVLERGRLLEMVPPAEMPAWAKPLATVALKLEQAHRAAGVRPALAPSVPGNPSSGPGGP